MDDKRAKAISRFEEVFARLQSAQPHLKAFAETTKAAEMIAASIPKFKIPEIPPFPLPPRFELPSFPFLKLSPILQEIVERNVQWSKLLDQVLTHDEGVEEALWSIGWVIHMEMPLGGLRELAGHVPTSPARVHTVLARYYEEALSDIESELLDLHPKRAPILAAAFAAHRRKEYVLSVPVLLAQCDGIAQDVLSVGLYAGQGAPMVEALRNSSHGNYLKRLGAILGKPGPIHAHESDLDTASDPLNRHRVLHGRTSTYGTRLKSAQAIALANFVGVVLARPLIEAARELTAWRTSTVGLSVIKRHWERGKASSRAVIAQLANEGSQDQVDVEVRMELTKTDKTVVRHVERIGPIEAGETRTVRIAFDVPARRAEIVAVVGR